MYVQISIQKTVLKCDVSHVGYGIEPFSHCKFANNISDIYETIHVVVFMSPYFVQCIHLYIIKYKYNNSELHGTVYWH